MQTTVVYHSADADGWFCREIARKFLPDADLIGWDFTDKPLPVPDGQIYILDLPVDRVFGIEKEAGQSLRFAPDVLTRVVWIDHHASSIASHPPDIPGYRIDGVAACRLAWQWFTHDFGPNNPRCHPNNYDLPQKDHYLAREVSEPLAVRLAGEYDVWDRRDERAEIFQYGLNTDSNPSGVIQKLLDDDPLVTVDKVLDIGYIAQLYKKQFDASMMQRSFLVDFDGLKFLVLNTARCNSLTFQSKDVPETGHDALMGFYFNGRMWTVSLYHSRHRTDVDLSKIAIAHGGGGHKGACGFTSANYPFSSCEQPA